MHTSFATVSFHSDAARRMRGLLPCSLRPDSLPMLPARQLVAQSRLHVLFVRRHWVFVIGI
jgi:hypothetical protein